jgi:hypothetical protein
VDVIRVLVILLLIGIVGSLGAALYQLYSSQGDSTKMVRALAVRVALSLALFLLLMIGWWAGLITPRGLGR